MWYSTFDCVKWGGELPHLRWIFPLVLESTYKGAVGSAIGVDSGPYDLVLSYRFLSKDLWIFSGWCDGYPTWDSSMVLWRVSHLFGSAIYRIFWKDSEDPGGACLSPLYTIDSLFSKLRLLAIIGLPWPMTLAPTNEAIRHETSGKKTLSVKVKKLTNLLGCHVIGVRIDFYQKA